MKLIQGIDKAVCSVLVVMLLLSANMLNANAAAKQPARQTFKCYLDTTREPQIGYFSWFPADTRINIASLPGDKLPRTLMTGNRSLYIKSVIECVPLKSQFSRTKARHLEDKLADLD